MGGLSVIVATLLLASAGAMENFFHMPTPYSYSCQEGNCVREKKIDAENPMTLGECTLSCGEYGSLWPKPSGRVELSQEFVTFHPQNVRVSTLADKRLDDMLDNAKHYFLRKLHFKHPEFPQAGKGPFNEFEYQPRRNNYKSRNSIDEERKNDEFMRYEEISPFNSEESNPSPESNNVDIEVTVTSDDYERNLRLDTDESYTIVSQTKGYDTTVQIIASTYYGVRHALESLSQLMAYDEVNKSLMMMKSVKIHDDKPAFKYRGIMLDTGRNYYPKDEIMRLLDTMSSNKLNTFHWHIADSASFPMYSQNQPEMTYLGAYSPSKVYYPKDIRKIVNYANLRGIRVIPELSAPSHTGAGWTFGEDFGKEKLVLCTEEDRPWFENCKEPPCGQLNPANPEVYNVLKALYRDIIDAFDPELVHMGGNDVSFKCWNNSPEIQTHFKENGKNASSAEYFNLWKDFQEKAYSKLTEATRKRGEPVMPIIYSSSFVRNYIDHKEYLVQITDEANSTTIEDYIKNNYKIIFSNADAWNFGKAVKSNHWRYTYTPTWEDAYENSPLDILYNFGLKNARSFGSSNSYDTSPRDLVLGGEATIWSFETDPANLQTTTWPRASAMAERLWSDPLKEGHGAFQADEVKNRLAAHRDRMVSEGTQAEVFQPEFCFRNQDSCYSKPWYEWRTSITPTEK